LSHLTYGFDVSVALSRSGNRTPGILFEHTEVVHEIRAENHFQTFFLFARISKEVRVFRSFFGQEIYLLIYKPFFVLKRLNFEVGISLGQVLLLGLDFVQRGMLASVLSAGAEACLVHGLVHQLEMAVGSLVLGRGALALLARGRDSGVKVGVVLMGLNDGGVHAVGNCLHLNTRLRI